MQGWTGEAAGRYRPAAHARGGRTRRSRHARVGRSCPSALVASHGIVAGRVRQVAPFAAAIEMEPTISRGERVARGKSARADVPLAVHAELPLSKRRDPLKLLEGQAPSRVPELLPIRYGRMAASPFAFFRGAPVVMAADLAETPASGMRAQLCGDAHLQNFGLFATPERKLVFDANDFDETLPGPWEWDLKRLVASVELACRADGFAPKDRRKCLLDVARAYREAMAEFAQEGHLDVWYAHLDAKKAME